MTDPRPIVRVLGGGYTVSIDQVESNGRLQYRGSVVGPAGRVVHVTPVRWNELSVIHVARRVANRMARTIQ